MFVIVSYDVNTKRVRKVLKICRKYLIHVHNSVFEGIITPAGLERLKRELKKVIDYDDDSICIYRLESTRYMSKEQIGVVEPHQTII